MNKKTTEMNTEPNTDVSEKEQKKLARENRSKKLQDALKSNMFRRKEQNGTDK